MKFGRLLTIAASVTFACPALAETPSYPTLVQDAYSRSPVPIPLNEKGLQTIVAEPWLPVSDKSVAPGFDNRIVLEGPAFDRQGDLLLTEVLGGRVMRVSANRNLSIVVPKNAFGSAGIGIHKDGRIFVAGVGDMTGSGSVFAVRADGSSKEVIVSPEQGYVPDDMVFDSKGGFYFTDLRGNNADPTGGVFYVSPDLKTITPIMMHMSRPNGIALSPDGKTLWVGETGTGLLHRIALSDTTTISAFGTTIPYHFTGARADSLRIDADGNVYVALIGEGRVLAFNSKGVPIGQILIPGRDEKKYLYTTSMAIKPGTNELYILASDPEGREAMIFRCGAFAKAPTLFSHM